MDDRASPQVLSALRDALTQQIAEVDPPETAATFARLRADGVAEDVVWRLLSAVFGVGGGLGIVLSGLIVDHVSWRWLFILGSIPVAIAPMTPATVLSRISALALMADASTPAPPVRKMRLPDGALPEV